MIGEDFIHYIVVTLSNTIGMPKALTILENTVKCIVVIFMNRIINTILMPLNIRTCNIVMVIKASTFCTAKTVKPGSNSIIPYMMEFKVAPVISISVKTVKIGLGMDQKGSTIMTGSQTYMIDAIMVML